VGTALSCGGASEWGGRRVLARLRARRLRGVGARGERVPRLRRRERVVRSVAPARVPSSRNLAPGPVSPWRNLVVPRVPVTEVARSSDGAPSGEASSACGCGSEEVPAIRSASVVAEARCGTPDVAEDPSLHDEPALRGVAALQGRGARDRGDQGAARRREGATGRRVRRTNVGSLYSLCRWSS
jgi:hypothetical protein